MTSSRWLVTSKKWSDCKGSGFSETALNPSIIQVLVFFWGWKFAYRFITFRENLGSIQGDSGSPPYRRREAKMVVVVVVGLVGWWVGWLVVGCWKQLFFSGWKKNRQVIWRSLNIPILPWKGSLTFSPSLLLKGTEKCQAHIFVEVVDLSP